MAELGTDIPIEALQKMAGALEQPSEAAAAESPYLQNLAKGLSKDELTKIGNQVVTDYKSDLSSRGKWEESRKNWLKLFAGYREAKNFPWDGCSNVHAPIMGIACTQFQARAYEALLPAKEYAKCWSTDGTATEKAARAMKYLNWQLMEEMDEWEEDMDVLLLVLPINGSAYKKTYFDSVLGRPSSRLISVDEFVTPYKCKRIEDAPRKTHAYYETLNNIRVKEQNGVFINTEDLKEGDGYQNQPSPSITEQADKINGIDPGMEQDTKNLLLLEQHRGWDLNGDGIEENYIITVDLQTGKVLRIEERDYEDPFTGKTKVHEYFTGYTFIPNPYSHYGFGFGHLLEGINESADAILNQLIDSGTLANTSSGFVSRRSGLKAGQINLAPGKFKEVDINSDDIRKAIFKLDFKEPSQALFALLGTLYGYGREISSVSESMMGKLPPSDTTATTMLAVMEQGLKVFSTIHKRVHRSFRKELKKIFALNGLYLDEQVYFMVQDSTSGDMRGFRSGRLDFANNIDVIPVSDPSIVSRAEKLIRAREAYQIGTGNPDVWNNPEARYELTRALFTAIEQPNVDKIVPAPKPPPPPPDLSPLEEEALWLQEKNVEPLQTQDHFFHLQSHEAFVNSSWGQQLTPQGKKLVDDHMMKTKSFAYLQMKEQQMQMMQQEVTMATAGGMNGGPEGMERMVSPSAYARAIERIGPEGQGAGL